MDSRWCMIAGGSGNKENVMKVVGVGTELKLGKVVKILNFLNIK